MSAVYDALSERFENLSSLLYKYEDKLSEWTNEKYEADKNVARFQELVDLTKSDLSEIELAMKEYE